MKVKVCMPDPISLGYRDYCKIDNLVKMQGQIIEVVFVNNTYEWEGESYGKDWFKVVEETPYQEWAAGREIAAESPETTFNDGRESLKPFLRKTLEWINLNFDNCPQNPVGLREHIKKELER